MRVPSTTQALKGQATQMLAASRPMLPIDKHGSQCGHPERRPLLTTNDDQCSLSERRPLLRCRDTNHRAAHVPSTKQARSRARQHIACSPSCRRARTKARQPVGSYRTAPFAATRESQCSLPERRPPLRHRETRGSSRQSAPKDTSTHCCSTCHSEGPEFTDLVATVLIGG